VRPRDQNRSIDTWSDLSSFGVTCYQMLTGARVKGKCKLLFSVAARE
jgi:hypothetical protein